MDHNPVNKKIAVLERKKGKSLIYKRMAANRYKKE